MVGVKQGVDGVVIIFLYLLWEVCCYDCLSMVCGIDVDYVQQISWVYWLVKLFFYYFVDFVEVCFVVQQLVEVGEVGEQYLVDEEVGIIIYYDWCFVYFVGSGYYFGNGII